MGYTVIEDIEDRVGDTVIRRKVLQTDDPQFPSGYRYALHYGYTDGRGTILRYDNENEPPDATSDTQLTVSRKSTSPEWWRFGGDSSRR